MTLKNTDNKLIPLAKRYSEALTEVAKNNLISRFGITDIQAKEILDMRLSKLTGLEKTKIEDEITRLKNFDR